MDRRKFMKFAGISGVARVFFGKLQFAKASSWQKLSTTGSTPGTWHKLNIATTTNNIGIASISACNFQVLALRSDGLVYGTGGDGYGQLGDNSSVNKSSYTKAYGISNIIAVAAGIDHSVVLRSDGTVFSCGYNRNGALGINSSATTGTSTFVQSIGISNAIAIACGYQITAAIRSDGAVFGCGYDSIFGSLGDNNTAFDRSTFVKAIGISNAVAIAAGGYNSLFAIRTDGYVFGAGFNNTGGLGDGTTVNKYTFVKAIGISNAIAIAGGFYHKLAIRADGNVFACGSNPKGLGDNGTLNRSTFVATLGVSNVTAIAAGYYHSLALRTDGIVFACGYNLYGQLGDGTTIDKKTFIRTVGISNIIAIACGVHNSAVLRADGLVFACGYNNDGELANNSTVGRSSFVQVIGI